MSAKGEQTWHMQITVPMRHFMHLLLLLWHFRHNYMLLAYIIL